VDLRIKGGCISSVVYRDPTDPTRVVVMNHMKDVQSARQYVRSPELIDAMYKARVVGAPSIQILEKVDEQSY
jgi:quinol monooxygenase YgiN